MTQTNSKDGFGLFRAHHLLYVVYGLLTVLRISRSITDKEPIEI